MKMKGFFNEVITKMVDDRINSMLPILKEKILKGEEPVMCIKSNIVHNGVSCKSCNMMPISGIRYKCPQCVNFNLCENCEVKIPHDHPLLKIKVVIEDNKEEAEFKEFRNMFKKFFKGHYGPHHRGSSSSNEKGPRRPHWFHKKIWGLSFIFGG